ncbi:MAG: S1 RNA-binding domain-containing protein [Anaerolineae bacterium]|jgi:transcriptional accessory protein Tex/SPT6|nr:S1 RNA-binding domain-containing protein [Anaerolineae bacterium]
MPEESTVQPTSIEELRPKMRLTGKVTRTELYGAFVNIGLEREGMVHISRLANRRVNKVTDKVQSGDTVTVWVLDVNPEAGRVGLTMVEPAEVDWDEIQEGQIRKGKVVRLERYGAFVELGAEKPGLLHVREMGQYVRHPSEVVKENEEVEVRVLRLDRRKRQIDLTMDLGDTPAADDEEAEPFVSSMELAFRKAQSTPAGAKPSTPRKNRRSHNQDDDYEDIYRHALESGR